MSRKTLIIALLAALPLSACAGKGATTRIESPHQLGVPLGAYRVPSESMAPTINVGERVEVYAGRPAIGSIVVFHPPEDAVVLRCGGGPIVRPGGAPCARSAPRQEPVKFVKRVVAGPGDTIKVIEGHVIRNGRREQDAYIKPCPGVAECNFPVPIRVPDGEWYLLGDNRGESDDSRFWGPVPSSWILGVVKGVVHPGGGSGASNT